MKRISIGLAATLTAIAAASAQTYLDSKGTMVSGVAPLVQCVSGGSCAGPVSSTNPLPVSGSVAQSGSIGADYSANKPALPNVGANFAAGGPFANYVSIVTVAASASRLSIDVENDSGAQIAIILDDGAAASGAAPNNASVFALGGGAGVGVQGGSWVSLIEKGRVQVYAPASTAQVAIRTN